MAPDTGATVTVAGPAIVIGLINSGGGAPGSMTVALSTVLGVGEGVGVGGGVGVGVGVGVGDGVPPGVGVGVGLGVGVGMGVGEVRPTVTTPRPPLPPSCVKL